MIFTRIHMQRVLIITAITLAFFSGISFSTTQRWDADKTNWSNLMLAVHEGDRGKVKQLISEGVNVNYLIDDGFNACNALIISIKNQNYELAKYLINNGADIKSIYGGETVLMIASRYENTNIIKILLKNGLDINANNQSGYTPLKAAVADGSVEVLKLLIDNGADINYQGVYGDTALMLGALEGNTEKVKVLLKAGANKNLKNKNAMTANSYNERAMDYSKNETEIKNRKIIRESLKINDNPLSTLTINNNNAEK